MFKLIDLVMDFLFILWRTALSLWLLGVIGFFVFMMISANW